MAQGFGVDEVLIQYCRVLKQAGIRCEIVCVEKLKEVPGIQIGELLPSVEGLGKKIASGRWTHVIAHTEPWISLLSQAHTPQGVQKIAWEHGDPTPELFRNPEEVERRRREKTEKKENAYPNMNAVVAISEFVRADIEWPEALVIPNPMPDFEKSIRYDPTPRPAPLKIGSLMRLGPGEAQYKGQEIFIQFAKLIQTLELNIEIFLAGKGSIKDAELYERNGIHVRRNLSHKEKQQYLCSLDLFFSPSLWEGFNLPVVEAQSLGIPSVVFDTGAHPEVCPHIFPNIQDLVSCIRLLEADRDQLERWSIRGQKQVEKMRKATPEKQFLELLQSNPEQWTALSANRIRTSRLRLQWLGLQHGWKSMGAAAFVIWLIKKTARRFFKP